MRKLTVALLSLSLLLGACAPNFQKQEEVVDRTDKTKEKAIIPKYQISNKYYRTVLPFVPSEARGLTVNNLNTRYDINEFEMGLMRIAQNTFDPDKYVFREGQVLRKGTVEAWLSRKLTKKQLAEKKMEEGDNVGLNPVDEGAGDIEARNEKGPIYLAHILEQDYLIKGEKDSVKLAGVAIGLALNSVHYYRKVQYGDVYKVPIERRVLEAEGKKIAQEVLKRLRATDELRNVPITIALFEQESNESVVPGSFFAYTTVNQGATIDKWEKVNEKYYLFPSREAREKYREDVVAFDNFKQDVEKYFPNFNGVVGKAHYVEGQLKELNIQIPIQFYGKAEGIGFTQYVTGLVMEHFPKYIAVSVSITSVNGPESLIVRKADQDEPFVHIY
ncbi:CamS family sex pheromone protein [Neobacillus notoginsengisoli]|uniref:CamS family sex pheromone protein n=1 Tax=Neobacillus notoginsengisoli TaxID=1578198 RepID=A0A417YHN9_9BACI|nr:CamS family sex pheromone protein [Neobacillus notoginsengisoli]RHW32473.1 CamS family sex pheromone protein [Neobacillus notoginsengisoli]